MPPKPEKKHGPDLKLHHGSSSKTIDKMYPTRVALSGNVKSEVVQIFQEQLANASDLYSQAKFAHWNVKGDNFYQLHLLFDSVAETVEAHIDPIAERLTQLGGVANGTIRQAASTSKIPEYDFNAVGGGMAHVKALADALGHYAKLMRKASEDVDDAGDKPSADFFNQLIVEAEKQLYFLESHIQVKDVQ
jgi:starvation-inducible DNA-binding protein